MKRRITIEQLQELTEEQQQRLREWWEPTAWDVIAIGTDDIQISNVMLICTKEYKIKCLPLLDIGQMIKLLNNKRYDWPYTIYDSLSKTDNELCDALWQAVKKAL